MASIVRVTPLYGVRSSAAAMCTVLEIDDATFLLDCGWSDRFDVALLEPLRPYVSRGIDAVLLSHPDVAHLGALPYLVGRLGLPPATPIYATTPVHRLGQMFLYDAHQQRNAGEEFDVFSLDDVDEAFERVHPVKYQQVIDLGQGVQATPYPAGHLLGGAVWKLQKESEEIVYCVDVNHRRERLLNGCAMLPQLISKPSHLIVGASGVLTAPSQKKESDMWSAVTEALQAGGDVLMPVDSAGRCLELVLAAEDYWEQHRHLASLYPVVFVQHVGQDTIEFARSLIEWMSDAVVNAFDSKRENPFALRHVQVVHDLEQADAVPGPKVMLAPLVSLDYGFSRLLLLRKFAAEPRSLVVLSDRCEPGTLGFRLAVEKEKLHLRGPLVYAERVPLEGEERERWERERQEAGAAVPPVAESAASTAAATGNATATVGAATTGEMPLEAHHVLGAEWASSDEEAEDEAELENRYRELVQRGVMLPHEDAPVPVRDAYGEVIDVCAYMIGEDPGDVREVRQAVAHQRQQQDNGGVKMVDERMEEVQPERMDGDAELPSNDRAPNGTQPVTDAEQADDAAAMTFADEALLMPTKLVQHTLPELSIQCAVRNYDMAGLADGRSLRQLIIGMAPQRVVIVHGSERETAALAEYLQRKQIGKVYTPRAREVADATSDTSVYRLQLSHEVLRRCRWRRVLDYELAWVEGVTATGDTHEPVLQTMEAYVAAREQEQAGGAAASKVDAAMRTAKAPVEMTAALPDAHPSPGHRTVFVGDLRLTDLKETMTKSLMPAEFAGGALCVENSKCQSVVLVRKQQQNVVLEGGLCDEFFDVRDLIYSQFVTV
ncbi:hypothetical protein CDCA_CDCA03G1093 [Cyanidium caldarium]|uniref:Cleavage and polyadenylation specificity factor subunit 2 n=1 Tax=Cyanidium caldarium TaxID=2771 RepID=A0AAV9IT72_CYACA|nr:hypothetical protein CDCA_CDCA03G1093 [Cyanidium caldarium]